MNPNGNAPFFRILYCCGLLFLSLPLAVARQSMPDHPFSNGNRVASNGDFATWAIVLGVIVLLGVGFALFWNSTRGAHSRRYKRIGQWLEEDYLWKQLSQIYYPHQVAQKREELKQQYALLSSNYRSNKATRELYDLLVEVRHSGKRFFNRRNDSNLRKAYFKLKEYTQNPLYDKESCAAVERALSEELAYFESKATGALSEGEKQRLHGAEQAYRPLLTHPEQLLEFNIDYLKERIEQALFSASFWSALQGNYLKSSIERIQHKWTSEYEHLCNHAEASAQGALLYQFLSNKIERLRRSPHRFLKAKPNPQNTAYPAITGSSYGSGGFMGSGESSNSEMGSSFGGDDFGGGGASGGW